MGAAEQQQFTQYPHRYGDGTLGAAIAQTRDGKDELVTPVALWELDDTSGLYLPPGLSQNPRRPRVDAQLSGSNAVLRTSEMVETISGNQSGELAAGTTETIVDVQQPCHLESLMVGANSGAVRLRVENRLADGTYQSGMRLVSANGAFTNPILPSQLHLVGGENDFWREFVYDTENREYAFGMKRQAIFASGLRIRLGNDGSEPITAGLTYMISKFHGGE